MRATTYKIDRNPSCIWIRFSDCLSQAEGIALSQAFDCKVGYFTICVNSSLTDEEIHIKIKNYINLEANIDCVRAEKYISDYNSPKIKAILSSGIITITNRTIKLGIGGQVSGGWLCELKPYNSEIFEWWRDSKQPHLKADYFKDKSNANVKSEEITFVAMVDFIAKIRKEFEENSLIESWLQKPKTVETEVKRPEIVNEKQQQETEVETIIETKAKVETPKQKNMRYLNTRTGSIVSKMQELSNLEEFDVDDKFTQIPSEVRYDKETQILTILATSRNMGSTSLLFDLKNADDFEDAIDFCNYAIADICNSKVKISKLERI